MRVCGICGLLLIRFRECLGQLWGNCRFTHTLDFGLGAHLLPASKLRDHVIVGVERTRTEGGRLNGRPLRFPRSGSYSGCAPICLRRVIESKYWRLSLIFPPPKVKKKAAGVSWRLPDAGIVPPAVPSGPVCVPFQVTSRAAVLPLATALVTEAAASGNAVFQPLKSSTIFSGPSTLRWVPSSS